MRYFVLNDARTCFACSFSMGRSFQIARIRQRVEPCGSQTTANNSRLLIDVNMDIPDGAERPSNEQPQ